jgi:hypothetical protein
MTTNNATRISTTSVSQQQPDQAESTKNVKNHKRRLVFDNRTLSFQDFLSQQQAIPSVDTSGVHPDHVPYLPTMHSSLGQGAKYFIEVYGCQSKTAEEIETSGTYPPFSL